MIFENGSPNLERDRALFISHEVALVATLDA